MTEAFHDDEFDPTLPLAAVDPITDPVETTAVVHELIGPQLLGELLKRSTELGLDISDINPDNRREFGILARDVVWARAEKDMPELSKHSDKPLFLLPRQPFLNRFKDHLNDITERPGQRETLR